MFVWCRTLGLKSEIRVLEVVFNSFSFIFSVCLQMLSHRKKEKNSFNKMTGDTFSIDWDDFSATSTERFRPLIREAKFSDVTLVSGDGQRIPGHQVILATGCTFFKNLLENEANSKPLIFFRGVEANLLQPLIDFLYTGKAQVAEELIANFVTLAEDFGVEGLANNCNVTQNESRVEESESEKVDESESKKVEEIESEKTDWFDVNDKNTLTSLEVVKKEVHSKNLDLPCNVCSETFDNKSNLKKHLKSHRPSPETVSDSAEKIIVPKKDENGFHKCNYCERKIRDHCNFRKHVQADHAMIVMNCNHCDYSTRIASNLSRHKKRHLNSL